MCVLHIWKKMATCDDGQWLLSLIENAYVTTDDTSISELVMQGGDIGRKHVSGYPFLYEADKFLDTYNDEPLPHSPDITNTEDLDLKFSGHRYRSYTQVQSDRIKKEREKASRIKKVHWHYKSEDETEDDLSNMFQRKTVLVRSRETSDGEPPPKPVSLLAHMLQNCPETNGFVKYSKYDGMTHNNVLSQQIKIFVYIGHRLVRDYPIRVSVVNIALVTDLIGLIGWIYTKENLLPTLKTVDHYDLHIADEDGGVDWEFRPLEKKDCIDKYGFAILALVEKDTPDSPYKTTVTIYFRDPVTLEVENSDITLQEILRRAIQNKKEIVKLKESILDYHIEKLVEPGVALYPHMKLSEAKCTEFVAIKENSNRSNGNGVFYYSRTDSRQEIESFYVCWQKTMTKFETKIDISPDMVTIHPMNVTTTNILFGKAPCPVWYPTAQLVDCIKEELKKKKILVHITMQGENSFEHYKFKCEECVGKSLYEKCRSLIKSKKALPRRRSSLSTKRRTKTGNFANEV